MTAADLAARVRGEVGPFIPAKYAALRTEAVDVLRRAVEAFIDADDRKLGRAICDGQQTLREIDGLWSGTPPDVV